MYTDSEQRREFEENARLGGVGKGTFLRLSNNRSLPFESLESQV